MKIGVPKEIHDGECRVAATPETVGRFIDDGYEVLVESGAGDAASFPDDAYTDVGAEVVSQRDRVWSEADIVVKVRAPEFDAERDVHEAELLGEGDILISLLWPSQNEALLEKIAERGATAFALDAVPRITRAQSMDVLSSMAGIAGYRAVMEAANEFGRFFGAQMTAAGSTPPANVLVIGAGVAGLQAVATSKEMGAIVQAFDTRDAVREEVESLGGKFLELEFEESGEGEGGYAKEMSDAFLEAERDLFAEEAKTTDIVITTASVPGKPAPKLLMERAVENLPDGAVIVDLAAEQGGNCELTEPGEVIETDGVTIIGYTNLTGRLPNHASHYFGRNIATFLGLFGGADDFEVDEQDRVVREMMVTRGGEVTWPPPEFEDPTPEPEPEAAEADGGIPAEAADAVGDPLLEEQEDEGGTNPIVTAAIVAAGAFMLVVGLYAPPDFVQHFTVFVLACFVGWQVVWNVTSSLHTPLMSVTNAISGIIIVGGLVQVGTEASFYVLLLGTCAILVATINIFGGFLVTQRMLGMFRAEEEAGAEGEGR